MSLQFYAGSDLSQPLINEITAFLDSQETSHLFQFPQWNFAGARFALLRESEKFDGSALLEHIVPWDFHFPGYERWSRIEDRFVMIIRCGSRRPRIS